MDSEESMTSRKTFLLSYVAPYLVFLALGVAGETKSVETWFMSSCVFLYCCHIISSYLMRKPIAPMSEEENKDLVFFRVILFVVALGVAVALLFI